jgi:hypothetical protein
MSETREQLDQPGAQQRPAQPASLHSEAQPGPVAPAPQQPGMPAMQPEAQQHAARPAMTVGGEFVHAQPSIATPDPRTKSPALACVLSAMPGLGQVYVGYYQRGFVHAIVVATIITLLATGSVPGLEPLMGFFLAFFWLYNIIDAGRRAALYNQVLGGSETIELPRDFSVPRFGSIFGGLALLLFGLLLLMHTKFEMSLVWVKDWWPVAPILFGAYLLVRGIQDLSNRDR